MRFFANRESMPVLSDFYGLLVDRNLQDDIHRRSRLAIQEIG